MEKEREKRHNSILGKMRIMLPVDQNEDEEIQDETATEEEQKAAILLQKVHRSSCRSYTENVFKRCLV